MKGEDGFGFGEERELSPSSITDPLCDSGPVTCHHWPCSLTCTVGIIGPTVCGCGDTSVTIVTIIVLTIEG